jgi:hypothetical protein
MTLKTRRIIYISLIIIFLIAAPLTILYSQGYSFDWQKKIFVKTGSFYLKSYPQSANIYIDGKKSGTAPLYAKRLLPKNYSIEISKSGFYPWQKNLKIESQIVTEARNILLIPEKPQLKTIDENLSPDFSLNDYFLKNPDKIKIQQVKTTAESELKTDSYTFSGDQIFYLQPLDRILYKADINGVNKQQVTLEPLPADVYKISVSLDQKFILALGKSERLYLLNPEKNIFELIETGVKNADFSLDSKKLLYYTGSEIWVKYLGKIQIQPYHEAGEKELITRFSEKINSAIWYPEDNEHIIFVVGNTIKITELDGRDKRNTYDLLKLDNAFTQDDWNNPQLYYNLDKSLLYFINNNKLYSVQIKAPQPIIDTSGWVIFGK